MKMYFIAIVLPAELDKEIKEWKHFMHEKYGCKVGLRSPAHITLVPPFWMDEEKEQQLLADVDVIGSSVKPFTVAANNFSKFKPQTIFIDVVIDRELSSLKNVIDNFFSNTDHKIKIDTRAFHPHITIATRDLRKKDFHEAWSFFQTKKYKAGWQANALSVLRHNSTNWEVIHTSAFRG